MSQPASAAVPQRSEDLAWTQGVDPIWMMKKNWCKTPQASLKKPIKIWILEIIIFLVNYQLRWETERQRVSVLLPSHDTQQQNLRWDSGPRLWLKGSPPLQFAESPVQTCCSLVGCWFGSDTQVISHLGSRGREEEKRKKRKSKKIGYGQVWSVNFVWCFVLML